MHRIHIKIHPLFCVYVICIACFTSWHACVCALSALIIHEFGHYIASICFGEKAEQIVLTPFGGVMHYSISTGVFKGIRGLVTAAAGPAANLAFLILISYGDLPINLNAEFLHQLFNAHLLLFCFNLLPVFPLDGGRMLFSIAYYFCNTTRLIITLAWLGILSGALLLLLAIYGLLIHTTLNASLIIVGTYLMICAYQSISSSLTENLYTVIQERMDSSEPDYTSVKKVVLYAVSDHMRLYEILPCMKNRGYLFFLLAGRRYRNTMISEKEVCQALLRNPYLTISELVSEIQNDKA